MKIALTNDSLPGLYFKGIESGIKLLAEGGGIYKASSRSHPGHWREVVIGDGFGECSCPAGFCGVACAHLALAAFESGVMIFTGMSDAALDGFEQMKRRLVSDSNYRSRVAARGKELIAA